MRELVIGTRGSALALWQTGWVAEQLKSHHPGLSLRIETITTAGDVSNQAPLWQIGGSGLFVKELERALQDERIDLAVHSMKDLPFETADGLVIAAVPEREDPRDVSVSRHSVRLAALPAGARIGTSSSRRRAQLLAFRPDFQVVPLRGNIDTRLRKSEGDDLDAVILAAAGLSRLGYLDRVTEFLDPGVCLPAVAQGALAVQSRGGDLESLQAVSFLDHRETRAETGAERGFMRALGGGCQVPLAALARCRGERLYVDALVASQDGSRVIRTSVEGTIHDPAGLGELAADQLRLQGAEEILLEH